MYREPKVDTEPPLELFISFEQGERGLVCKKTPDRGAFIVPVDSQGIVAGVIYKVRIVRTAQSGKLRFAEVIETRKASFERTIGQIKEAINDVNNIRFIRPFFLEITTPEGKFYLQLDRNGFNLLYSNNPSGYSFKSPLLDRLHEEYLLRSKEEGTRQKEIARNEAIVQIKALASERARQVIESSDKVKSFLDENPRATSMYNPDDYGYYPNGRFYTSIQETEGKKVFFDTLNQILKENGVRFNITWEELSSAMRFKAAELESDPIIKAQKERILSLASQRDSENGPLGRWKPARLEVKPEDGAMIKVDGKWYVSVIGYSKERTGDYSGGIYARWVEIPEDMCQGW